MKREEAINIVRNIYQTDKEKEALATLIPELSEDEDEDEKIRKELVNFIKRNSAIHFALYDKFTPEQYIAYLEKQKEQKPVWSEEDEEMLEYVIGDLNDAKQLFHAKDAKDLCDKEIAWLKSRRPSWKPSEEQMAALEAATVRYQSTGLESLFEDLKKL